MNDNQDIGETKYKLFTRDEVLKRLHSTLEEGHPIVGAGAGTGISAKFAEAGGADLILVYNSGKFRMAGHGSNAGLLALGDANEVVMQMGEREVLPVVRRTPVIAGVNGTDPTRNLPRFLRGITELGFSGVINFPSHGIIDGHWRASLESTGFGYDREVDMIGIAHEQGMFTLSYCFTPEEATEMARAGVDVVVAHMGLTTGGSIGAGEGLSKSLEDCIALTGAIKEAASAVRSDVIIVTHGGPIETPDDAASVINDTGIDGFIGASTMERLPVESALERTVAEFTRIELDRR